MDGKEPVVSVIMSIYKEPVDWIQKSIDSILHQTYGDFEFLIVDDNPGRRENELLLREYVQSDPRVKAIRNDSNIGLTKSLNKAIGMARGFYIARMDADDVSYPERFRKQIEVFNQDRSIGICGCAYNKIGGQTGVVLPPEFDAGATLCIENCFAHSSVMFRRDLFKDACVYDESCVCAQDYELWSRLYRQGVKFYNIQEPLLDYRVTENQISKTRMQNDVARRSRRLCLDYMLEKVGADFRLGQSTVDYGIIHRIDECEGIAQKTRQELVYYMFLSIGGNLMKKVSNMIPYWSTLSISQMVHIIYHHIRKTEIAKY